VTSRLTERADLAANAAAFSAAVLFGASVVAVRVAVREIPPTTLAVFRFGIGAAALFAAAALVKPELLRVGPRSLRFVAVLGAIIFTLFPLSFNVGLQYISASRGALMIATMPIWSMFLARLIVGERLSRRQILGVTLSVCGIVIVVSEHGLALEGGGRTLLGYGLLLLTAFWGALYGVLAKRALEQVHPLTLISYAMLIGTLVLVPFAVVEGIVDEVGQLHPSLVALVLFLGIPGGAIGFGLWTAALTRLSPTQLTVYINLNPVVAAMLGVVLLSEEATPLFLLSFAVVISGVMLVNWPTN
jgi:drug/metabolite transporter (DMT)-like permease